MGIVVLFRG